MNAATPWIVVLTGIGSLMAALDTMVVTTALSTIRVDLDASVGQLEWTVNAYNLSFAVLLITGAAVGDRFGRRRLYAVGLGLFALASAACALALDGWLIAGQAAQGAGAALVMPLGLALLSAAFPPEKRGAAIGIFSAITGLAVASGPLVGGAVIQGISWEWIFWVNVPIALIAVPLVLTKSVSCGRSWPRTRGAWQRPDRPPDGERADGDSRESRAGRLSCVCLWRQTLDERGNQRRVEHGEDRRQREHLPGRSRRGPFGCGRLRAGRLGRRDQARP